MLLVERCEPGICVWCAVLKCGTVECDLGAQSHSFAAYGAIRALMPCELVILLSCDALPQGCFDKWVQVLCLFVGFWAYDRKAKGASGTGLVLGKYLWRSNSAARADKDLTSSTLSFMKSLAQLRSCSWLLQAMFAPTNTLTLLELCLHKTGACW